MPLTDRDNDPWRLGWRIDQRFAKGNKDPENTVFGTAIWDCDEPIYAGALFILALALADGALFGFTHPEEVFEQRIPPGKMSWYSRGRTRRETDYQKDLRRILIWIGFFITATVHAMRRELRKAVAGTYARLRGDLRRQLLANCSGVDVVNALRRRPTDHTHLEYFQGFEQYHENGLPHRLPTKEEEKLDEHPDLVAKDREIEKARSADDIKKVRQDRSVIRRKLYSKALQNYHTLWVQERRDWKILTRGRERPNHVEQVAQKQALCKLMPELGRLAAIMSSNEPLSFHEKASVVRDLYTQCLREFSVVYRPGEEPVKGRCPVTSCNKDLNTLSRPSRSNHIHGCVRQSFAQQKNILLRHIKYCWECFTFHDGTSDDFEQHCRGHLPSMTSQHYGDEAKPAACRMSAFKKNTELKEHLEGHIQSKRWPSECVDPSCSHTAADEVDYRRHLRDVHHYQRNICVRPETTCKKRSSSALDESSTSDRKQPMEVKRPCKRQKAGSKPSHGIKGLTFINWGPPTARLRAMSPAQVRKKDQDNQCPSINLHAVSQDGHSARSASLDLPGLIDDTSTCSSYSAVPPAMSAIPIDPQILQSPPGLCANQCKDMGSTVPVILGSMETVTAPMNQQRATFPIRRPWQTIRRWRLTAKRLLT
ncbi:hypothetical protein BDV35DRAFT_396899 [Aspergillus flavus]|uniref:Uncharacterized protein n=1 Tax=Aspergillus flavus TaxID=5059 RepID=A0A5N6GLG2_ASPFL|nr:hypothetical protein BDV35DRAFT_396899 [Aspergillus flavus]